MALFWEFFTFELKFRLKSWSTYVYFLIWFSFSFLCMAAEGFINFGNGKTLLNGPLATTIIYLLASLFGTIVSSSPVANAV